VKRGEIWWASLPVPRGSEPGLRRPVLIVQSDVFNTSSIGTVIAVTITSNLRLADAPGNVRLSTRQSKLPRASVVNVSQLATLDRTRLTERVSSLSHRELTLVDAGLRLVLSV
jgi:mRNA interferase MazF